LAWWLGQSLHFGGFIWQQQPETVAWQSRKLASVMTKPSSREKKVLLGTVAATFVAE
jgi:hypothetical protein